MNRIIDAAFSRARTVVSIFLVFLFAGTLAYQTIPKEAEPDIPIPIIYVSSTLDGISPEDAERLLVKPIEKVLQTIEGVKEIRSTASEGRASVVLELMPVSIMSRPWRTSKKRSTRSKMTCRPMRPPRSSKSIWPYSLW